MDSDWRHSEWAVRGKGRGGGGGGEGGEDGGRERVSEE